MPSEAQKVIAKGILHGAVNGPDRMIDVEIGRALGWRVSRDGWWNHRGNRDDGSPIYDPPGDEWCIRRDARRDIPCNEALPTFTFMPRHDAEAIINEEGQVMIRPNMALTYSDALRVYRRKGIWMVEYLRARRSRDRLIGYIRRQHFKLKRPCAE